MPVHLINASDEVSAALLAVNFVDDFVGLDTAVWNTVEGDAGSSIAHDADGANGVVDFATTSDNEEAYLYSHEILKFVENKSFVVSFRLSAQEAATNAIGLVFGVADGIAANFMLDNGGGVDATFDGAVFYKLDGETNWHFLTSDGTTKIDTVLDIAAGQSDYQTIAIEFNPNGSGTYEATPLVDVGGGNSFVQPAEFGANARNVLVKHNATFTTPTEMAIVAGVKQGSATAESMKLDLVVLTKKR